MLKQEDEQFGVIDTEMTPHFAYNTMSCWDRRCTQYACWPSCFVYSSELPVNLSSTNDSQLMQCHESLKLPKKPVAHLGRVRRWASAALLLS